MPYTIESPLKAYPGRITLPDPDDFNGIHWRVWKAGVNKPKRASYALVHLYAYSGLKLIKAAGEWEMERVNGDGEASPLPLGEVQAWEDAPEDERIRLISWIGREVQRYMDSILDPKGSPVRFDGT